MSPGEKVILIAIGGLLLGSSMSKWRPPDVAPALAYAKRCGLGPNDAYKATAVAVWSTAPDRQPCPSKVPS